MAELRDAFRSVSADVGDLLEQVRAVGALGGPGAARGPRAPTPRPANAAAMRRLMRDAINAYAREPYALEVPGTHYSGLTNQHLFAVLARQNRKFLQVTRVMTDYCRTKLLQEYEGASTIPLRIELDETWREGCEEVVEARMDGRMRDVPVHGLTLAYARAKARAGYGGQPVGVRKGDLLESVARIRVLRGAAMARAA